MSWIEKRLADLAAEGYFDDLPGSGQPLADLDTAYSPSWWAARWVARDAAQRDMVGMRRRLTADVAAALELPRAEARHRLEAIHAAVDEINRLLDSTDQLPNFDVDSVIIRGGWDPVS